jgi:CubicO group peptidase (beta-lactamase class C family)
MKFILIAKWRTIPLWFGLILSLCVPAVRAQLPLSPPEDVGMSSERLGLIGQALSDYVKDGDVPGFVTLIARRGRIVHWKGHGKRSVDLDEPMPRDAIFDLASMTKPITVVSAMILYEEGRIVLDEPISKHLPDFRDPKVMVAPDRVIPADREITAHDLLTHTSGIDDPRGRVEKFLYRTLEEHMKDLSREPLRFQPGTQWLYGDSHAVLGYLVEVVSQERLDKYWQRMIFEPLGMTDTHYWVPQEKEARRAILLQEGKSDPEMKARYPRIAAERQTYVRGAGGLHATALDYWRFCQMLLNGGELNGVRLLSPKTIEWMTVNHIGTLTFLTADGRENKNSFGLGVYVVTERGRSETPKSVGSYGWGGALGTTFWIDPEEELIGILMSQVRPHSHLDFRDKFEALTYAAIVD